MANKKTTKKEPVPLKDRDEIKVYTMPDKFFKSKREAGGSNGKLIAFIIIAIVVVSGGIGLVLFLNQQTAAPPVAMIDDNQPADVQTPDEPEEPEVTEPEPEPEEPEVEPEVEPEEPDLEPFYLRTYLSSRDTDEDGLTDLEESIYATYISRPDSDGDGHSDTLEILNLYNPGGRAPANLIDSGHIDSYNNERFNYLVFYPENWVIFTKDATGREVVFKTSTSETITVKVEDNNEKLSIQDWFIQEYPDIEPETIRLMTLKNGMRGVKTPNGLIYHMIKAIPSHIGKEAEEKTKVYTFIYDPGELSRLNFKTTYEMMLRSFVLLETEDTEIIDPANLPDFGLEGELTESDVVAQPAEEDEGNTDE